MVIDKYIASVSGFLASVSGFEGIAESALRDLAGKVEIRRYRSGDALIRKGEAGDCMHVLHDGRVRVVITDEAGAEKMIFFVEPGEVVGEMALITGEPRTADVYAEDPVVTFAFHRAIILPFLRRHPQLAGFLTNLVADRIQQDITSQSVGKYRLLRELGKGKTAIVYEGIHAVLDRLVAIKMLSHRLVFDEVFLSRFLREARLIASLTHPNIVQVFDTDTAFGTHFIVMEKARGHDLANLLKERKRLTPEEASVILTQVGSALAYAHDRGLVHRDVKPANCMVDEFLRVKLTDFGVAQRVDELTDGSDTVEGTPRFMAPEAVLGRTVDGRADIYSLGVMAFALLSGRLPFRGKTAAELMRAHVEDPPPDIASLTPDLPRRLVDFVNGALVKDPEARLRDWRRILPLLAGEAGLGLADGDDEAGTAGRSKTLTVRYPAIQGPAVLAALDAIEGVEVVTDDGDG